MYHSLTDMIQANKRAGGHWFDDEAMRAFKTRLDGCIYGGRYFISSTRAGYDGAGREYAIMYLDNSGHVQDVGWRVDGGHNFTSKRAAETTLKAYLSGAKPWPVNHRGEQFIPPKDPETMPHNFKLALQELESVQGRLNTAVQFFKESHDGPDLCQALLKVANLLEAATARLLADPE